MSIDVAEWLGMLGLGQYAPALAATTSTARSHRISSASGSPRSAIAANIWSVSVLMPSWLGPHGWFGPR